MKKYMLHSAVWPLLLLVITDALFFGFTSPTDISSPLLIIGFGLVALTVWLAARSLRMMAARHYAFMDRHRRIDVCVTGVVCASLALSSLGQLSSRDFVLLLIAAAAGYWYVGYQKRAVT